MKKPHEETWIADVKAYTPTVCIEGAEGFGSLVAEVWRRQVTTDEAGSRTTRPSCEDAARFIAAAPDMARALHRFMVGAECVFANRPRGPCPDSGTKCGVCEARAALKKAGVI